MATDDLSPEELRKLYINGTPRQRYHVATQRIEQPELVPTELINVMSAVEGVARSIAVHALKARGVPVESAYACVKHVGPVELIRDHVCPTYQTTPDAALGSAVWSQLPEAVRWRNLLVHEATSIDGGTGKKLVAAARHVLTRLGELAGVA